MPPQIKQAKLRDEFIAKFRTAFFFDKEMNEAVNWWLAKLSQAKLETLEAIIKEVETLRVEKPRRKEEESLYEVKKMVVAEVKATLLSTLRAELEIIKNER